MAETVYLLGAGINRCVRDWHGLQPPLATDLFQQALKHPRIASDYYRKKITSLFEYIQRFWKLSAEKLENTPFDLEACYTLIQLQASEANLQEDMDKVRSLWEIEYRLTALLAEYLTEFEAQILRSEVFRTFGQIIFKDSPAVLTFNYDTLLEYAIETASGMNPDLPVSMSRMDTWETSDVPDEELPISRNKWNRQLAYGVEFDEVILDRPGIPLHISGERFYSHLDNTLYNPPLLKLHGSLNWFVYTGHRWSESFEDEERENKAGKTALLKGYIWHNNQILENSGEIILPIIITPVLNKDFNQPIFRKIWKRAYEELSTSKRLIVGGYSFPPTDFSARRLFLEAFSDHSLEEIVVINPDTRVVQLVKDMCHFKKPVLTCRDLDEFISIC